MILSADQIRAVKTPRNKTIRYGYEDPNLPDLGPGETVPVDTRNGNTLFWVKIECNGSCQGRCEGLGSYADDTAQEIVYEYRRTLPLDSPRLLTPAGRPKGSELGYTDKPYLSMIDEPEAVDQDTQDRLTLEAIGRDAKRRREQSIAARRERELLPILERIELVKAAAAQNHISVHAEVKALAHMRKRGRSEGLIQAELERVERIAYRDAA
jgi:hypothetical protein